MKDLLTRFVTLQLPSLHSGFVAMLLVVLFWIRIPLKVRQEEGATDLLPQLLTTTLERVSRLAAIAVGTQSLCISAWSFIKKE